MDVFSVFTVAVYLLLFIPLLSHMPPHPETDSVGDVPFVTYNFGTKSCFVFKEVLTRAFKSTNYKHENTGSGLSYSGRNDQWCLLD
jgi:hypothetical protein